MKEVKTKADLFLEWLADQNAYFLSPRDFTATAINKARELCEIEEVDE